MALNENHAALERRSGIDLRDRLRARSVMVERTFTGFTGTPVPGGTVQLVYPDNPAADDQAGTVSTSRTPSWGTAGSIGSELAEMKIERSVNDVVTLPYVDIQSSPFDQIQAANEKMSHKLAVTIDNDLAQAFIDGVPAAAAHTPAALGDATNFIGTDGSLTGDADGFIVEAFLGAAKWMLANNMIGTGEDRYSVWAICPGPVWGTWLDYIKSEKPSDSLFNLFVGPGSQHIADVDQSQSIRVHLYNRMPTASVSSKDHWQILFGTDRVMSFAAAPPVMASVPVSASTSGQIGASYGQAIWWGRHVLNPEQLRVARIRQEA